MKAANAPAPLQLTPASGIGAKKLRDEALPGQAVSGTAPVISEAHA
jgi:hypothetical protein